MSNDIVCWWCGVEPVEVIEVGSFAGVVRRIPHWPEGDHPHAEQPPSADELLDGVLLRRGGVDD